MTTSQVQSDTAADATTQSEMDAVADVLRAESTAIDNLAGTLGPEVIDAIDLIDRCRGHVVLTGLGKSGLIAQKISATLSSIGVPSNFMHPAEALHGDLGRIRSDDLLLALSLSGNTDEVVQLSLLVHEQGVPIIAITSNPKSRLADIAQVHLSIGVTVEACPHNLAPTSSTTAMLALGDAIAIAVSRRHEFSEADFRKRHPGGALGTLLLPLTQILRFKVDENLPLIPVNVTVGQALALAEIGRRPGAMLIVNKAHKLVGLFTDGDLRRLLLKRADALDVSIESVMTANPRCLPSSSIVRDAVTLVQEFRPDEIPIVDDDGKPIGLIDVQDLIALRVIQE